MSNVDDGVKAGVMHDAVMSAAAAAAEAAANGVTGQQTGSGRNAADLDRMSAVADVALHAPAGSNVQHPQKQQRPQQQAGPAPSNGNGNANANVNADTPAGAPGNAAALPAAAPTTKPETGTSGQPALPNGLSDPRQQGERQTQATHHPHRHHLQQASASAGVAQDVVSTAAVAEALASTNVTAAAAAIQAGVAAANATAPSTHSPPPKSHAATSTQSVAPAVPSLGAHRPSLSGVAAVTAAIGVTKHSWNDGSYRRVPNDYRLETTVSPLEAWQRWHLGEVLSMTDPITGETNDIVIPPWKTLGSADLKGHSRYSTNTTNQDIKNVRLICRAFDAAAGLTADSSPTAEELRLLYETERVKAELPPNETPKGRKREVAQLSWLTCAKDKRRRMSLENPDKERHPGGRPRKSSVVQTPKLESEHPANSMAAAAAAAAASFAASNTGGGSSGNSVHGNGNNGGIINNNNNNNHHSSPTESANRRRSSYISATNTNVHRNNAVLSVPKSAALMEAEEEVARQKAIQEKQKTVFELLKSRAELQKLGVSEDHIDKYFPLPGSSPHLV